MTTTPQPHPSHPGYVNLLEHVDEEYFNGTRIGCLDYPEFAIFEAVEEPGCYYGPYSICRRRTGRWDIDGLGPRAAGIVAVFETMDEAKAGIPDVALRDVHPLPWLTVDEPVRFKIAKGHEVEVLLWTQIIEDIWTTNADCVIFSPEGRPMASLRNFDIEDLLSLRDSEEYFEQILHKYTAGKESLVRMGESAVIIEGNSPKDLAQGINAVKRGRQFRVLLGEKYEAVFTKKAKNIVRDADGKRDRYNKFREGIDTDHTVGLELVFDVLVRMKEGYLSVRNEDISLNVRKLCELVTDPGMAGELAPSAFDRYEDSILRRIADDLDGDVTCVKQLGHRRCYNGPNKKQIKAEVSPTF